MSTTRPWVLIGVPTSAGAHHAGQERAPAALRAAGFLGRLRAAGITVTDGGDLPVTPFQVSPGRYRNLTAVARVAGQVRDRVAAMLADGGAPLVVGGDCTITLGAAAGFGPQVRLVYEDGDTDLGGLGNADAPGSGILDSTGVAHLLGEGAPVLTGLGAAVPLVSPERLALVGGEGPVLSASPVETARRALSAVGAAGPLLVHFDVDVIDSGELPLANFPHYDSGVTAAAAFACLRELCQAGAPSGLVLTEVNPTHDPFGDLLGRYIDGVVSALAPG